MLSSFQYQFLSIKPCLKKKRRKRKETPQKRKWKLCEAEGILQFICLGLRKVLHFPMIGKWGMAAGGVLTAHIPVLQHAAKDLLQH